MGGWQQRAVGREAEEWSVGEPRCGWKHAMWVLLREKENLAWGCLGWSRWDALVLFYSLQAEIALLMFSFLRTGGLSKGGRGGGRRERNCTTGSTHSFATKPLDRTVEFRLLLFPCFGDHKKRGPAHNLLHSFITWVKPDAAGTEMKAAQCSPSEVGGESISRYVITRPSVWSGMAARASTWWAWRADPSLREKASAEKVILALQETFLHSLVLTTPSNFPASEETV